MVYGTKAVHTLSCQRTKSLITGMLGNYDQVNNIGTVTSNGKYSRYLKYHIDNFKTIVFAVKSISVLFYIRFQNFTVIFESLFVLD